MAAQTALETLVENMTLRQLADKSERSVSDIVGWAMRARASGTTAKKAAPKAKPAAKRSSPKTSAFDVRKPSGRAQYDSAVLEVVAGAKGPASAQEIRAKVGGTPAQARAALNRLIEDNKLKYQGRARATRYFLAN